MRKSIPERFWAKVNYAGPLRSPYLGPCWVWTARTHNGYGCFQFGSRVVSAHRVAYELVRGAIPEGLGLDHLCRAKECVNPAHLEAVTHLENVRRGESASARHARQTHCKHGHEFTPENTYRTPDGRRRQCRSCRREAERG